MNVEREQDFYELLHIFDAWNKCLTLPGVSNWLTTVPAPRQVRQPLRGNFAEVMCQPPGDTKSFLADSAMSIWWARFNLRLAVSRRARLDNIQLTEALNELLPSSNLRCSPEDLLYYGKQFGFVLSAWTPGYYVFPLAHILAQVPPGAIEARRGYVAALLSEVMRKRGSPFFDNEHPAAPAVCGVAQLLGIPYARTKWGNFLIFGMSKFNFSTRGQSASVAEYIDLDVVCQQLDTGELSWLPGDIIPAVAQVVVKERLKRLNKPEKVYLTLREIGRPAHFSEVSGAYNDIFPDDPTREHNVHAILSRCAAPDTEQYGIVWVGVKGTYALKEHGYERPKLGIFEAVTKIVADKYAETGKSVHISVITTELGKYRQFINSTSLAHATGFNDRIEQVSKDYFIPKAARPEVPVEDKSDEQSRIFREFLAERSNNA